MGIFNKIFGGKQTEPEPKKPTPPPAQHSTSSVQRRERTKREPTVATPMESVHAEQGAISEADADATLREEAIGDDPLLDAIDQVVKADSVATRQAFYATLLQSKLYLLLMSGEVDVATGEVTLQPGQQISLATLQGPDGKVFLPAFTDAERIHRSIPEGKARFVRLPAQGVFQLFLNGPGAGLVINAGQPPMAIVSRAEAESLARGQAPELDDKGQVKPPPQREVKLMLAKPKDPPPASFVAAIREAASQQPSVMEAHVFLGAVGEGKEPKMMIGLQIDDDRTEQQMQESFSAVGKAAFDAKGELTNFDMLPLYDDVLNAVKQLDGLVYRRSQ